jgi:hypothetical protein
MANNNKKNKKKNQKKKNTYEVGYGKPPKEYQWKKGCRSPNPKGRPKKIRTLKEALQVSFNKEITTKNENGDVKKISCLEALASKTIADAISKDGPTRRLLYRQDLMNLVSKEQEIEYTPDEQKIVDVQNEYGKLLLQWAETEPKLREIMSRIISDSLIDLYNTKQLKGN